MGIIKDSKPYMIFEIDVSSKLLQQAFDQRWNSGAYCNARHIRVRRGNTGNDFPWVYQRLNEAYLIVQLLYLCLAKTTHDLKEIL